MALYAYDVTKIADGGKDQMRFELGDVEVEGGKATCALSDEEYTAMITKATAAGRSFEHAKYLCLKAIVAKFAFEVDYSAGGMSLSLSQRYERWKAILKEKERERPHIRPTVNPAALGTTENGGNYFYLGMHDNPNA
jgi:hypothetical protein